MIKALFKFAKIPEGAIVIDTTSSSGQYRELSPFVLPAPPAKNFENLWQFSKVYKSYWDSINNTPTPYWYQWRRDGFAASFAIRYPMGKGAIPICSWWQDKPLNYIEARKKIYALEYAKNVIETSAFKRLKHIYQDCYNTELILLDYDAYDHLKLGMSLIDVINNPSRKMGHAFVLIMMLTDMLDECINS